jgi:hypothetical protein
MASRIERGESNCRPTGFRIGIELWGQPPVLTAPRPSALIVWWGALDEGENQASDGWREGRGTLQEKFHWRPVAPTQKARCQRLTAGPYYCHSKTLPRETTTRPVPRPELPFWQELTQIAQSGAC